MNSNERYLETLRSVWGYENFRGIQLSIIQSIGEGKDTLGLMPTGGGKSITFQVPALCMTGTCLVITPLIALMKDQIRELKAKGIRAAAIHSDMTHEQCVIALDNCILGNYKFLYVSPERLSSPFFLKKIKHLQLSFITVDEAHCICQWGYDFRPSYTHIADFRAECHDVPILALTATATPEVARDIQKQLNFPTPNVFRMSFHRPNLSYYIRRTDIKIESLKHLLESTEGSVIIYLRNRLKCESLAEQLTKSGLSANAYHAGLKAWVKDERQESWLKGETRIIVATNAFGMGINKPDVR
ncbi:MAG: ATP-dependent DNA helicase RecQ, partial [Bacteroidaceae bacterium]|nr:ATP-dependent DNA helicase RecQ [Bacteroidaceae bacterium]